MQKRNRKGQIWQTLIPWMIAAGFLVLMVIVFVILSGKGQGAITFFKNLVRFGR